MCKHTEKTHDSQQISKEYEPGLVSVIIPTYNRADLVRRAIQSVLDQTYKNLEVIVVDDASTDDTEEIVKGFSDQGIHYFRHEQNKGGGAARNTGIKASRGEYIAFLDSDCEWLPEKIEKQLNILRNSSTKLGAVGAGTSRYHGNESCPAEVRVPHGEFGDIHGKLLAGEVMPGTAGWPGSTSTILIKRQCFQKAGLFDELLECGQEFELFIRIAEHFHFDAIPESLVKFNLDAPHRITSNINAQVNGRKRILEKYSNVLPRGSLLRTRYNFTIGIILCRQGKMKEGRSYLWKAVASRPFSLRNWLNFLMSVFPFRIFKYLSLIKFAIKEHIIQLFGKRPESLERLNDA